MIDAQENRTHTDAVPSGAPVPAARPLSDFAVEQVGDELVLFDAETMQYHTLNGTAYQIWHRCDGRASAAAVAADLGLTVEVVQETVNDLGVASLLQSPPESWPTVMTRRRATRYIAAGVASAVRRAHRAFHDRSKPSGCGD
ncbi:MAG: PqqD family protein [Thermomicrobiales bacterium]|nr:PqqD family protein [Thermomicrobiales bacterium]